MGTNESMVDVRQRFFVRFELPDSATRFVRGGEQKARVKIIGGVKNSLVKPLVFSLGFYSGLAE